MVWMRLSPLFLCIAVVLALASGAVGKPIQAGPAQSLVSPDESSQTPTLTGMHRGIR
jgi:hypothetical protein